MLRNLLTVAFRNLLRQPTYSLLNVVGLATGLASAVLILLWVNSEMRVDTLYKDSDRIYRIISNLKMSNDEILTWTITPGPLAEAIADEIPEIDAAVRTMNNGSRLFQYEDRSFLERCLFADSTFFQLLTFEILKGDADHLDKNSIAISEKLAGSLFGDGNPIGKVLKVGGRYDLEIRSVFKDIADESSLRFEAILPMDIYKTERGDGFNWGNYDHPLYVRLHEGASLEETVRKINELAVRRVKALNDDPDATSVEYEMMGLNEYYLNSNFVNGVPVGGRGQYVKTFSIVAVFILLIACINFMNMATARAMGRAKEVGVRKVVGAQRQSLILQFMGESFLTNLFSMVVALCIVGLVLPLFNSLVSKHISLDLTDPQLLTGCMLVVVISTLLSGGYPAFFLSSYKPASVLKGTLHTGSQGALLRKGLVVFQFALTVIMVASAIVVQRQINFVRNKHLGYDRSEVLTFSAVGDMRTRFDAFRTEAEKIPGVSAVSRANHSLVSVNNQTRSVEWPGAPEDGNTFFRVIVTDQGYLEAMGVALLEGRFFTNSAADSAAYIITQNAADIMALASPLGTQISVWGNPGTIIGVVDNIYSRSLHEPMDPLVFMFRPAWTGNVVVKYEAGVAQDVVQGIEALSKKFAPEYPFAYTFLDDDFERLYNSDKVTGSLAMGFTAIAIILSALGLLGLAAFTAERKRKEISVRKTLGASVATIVSMMTKDYARLSIAATIVGCPAAWYLMEKFLEGYIYHMDLTVDIFLVTAVAVMVISLLTVIVMVVRAAVANPVDALRSE
jgi:putative ABC transport system permease protein